VFNCLRRYPDIKKKPPKSKCKIACLVFPQMVEKPSSYSQSKNSSSLIMNRDSSTGGPSNYSGDADAKYTRSHRYKYHLPENDHPDKSAFALGLISNSKDSITTKQEQLSKVDAVFAGVSSKHRIYETPAPFDNYKQQTDDELSHLLSMTGVSSGQVSNNKGSSNIGRSAEETRVREQQTGANKSQNPASSSRSVNFSRPVNRNSLVTIPRPLATANQAANLEFAANTARAEQQKETVSKLRRMFPTGQLPPFQKAEQALLDCKGDIDAAYKKLGGKRNIMRTSAPTSFKSNAAGLPKGITQRSNSSTAPKSTSSNSLETTVKPPPKTRSDSSTKAASKKSSTPLTSDSPLLQFKPLKHPIKTPVSKLSSLPPQTPIKTPNMSISGPKATLTTILGTKKGVEKSKPRDTVDQLHGLYEVVDRTAYRSGGDINENIDSLLSSVAQDYPPGFIEAFRELKTDTNSSEYHAQFDYDDDFYVSTDAKDIMAP